jgi:hypothetical protein
MFYSPLTAIMKAQQLAAGAPPYPTGPLAQTANADDPLEWPSLLAGGWTANAALYIVAGLAYRHPLRIGATYLLLAGILFVAWLLLYALCIGFYVYVASKVKRAHG